MSSYSHQRSVLVTGAGGFIGGWTAESLFMQDRWHVRAGVRRWSGASRIARFPMDIVLCDIKDPASLQASMQGVTDVIHCATGDASTIVDGTRNVLDAALKCGARVIHLSSIAVYGAQSGLVDEQCAFARDGSEYALAKIESERLCNEYQKRGARTVILRPTIVYGPYSTLWTTNVALRLITRQWGYLGAAGEGLCNLVYVEDLVRAMTCVLDSDYASGEAFNINGPEAFTWNDYFERFNAMLGLPELRRINPTMARWKSRLLFPARCLGKFMLNNHRELLISLANRSRKLKAVLKSTESTMRATATADQFALYQLKARYPVEKAARVLGYAPGCDIQTGLALGCAWLRHSGALSK